MRRDLPFAEQMKLYAAMMGMILRFETIRISHNGGIPDLRTLVASGGAEMLGAHIGVEKFISALGACERYREVLSPCLARLRERYPDSRAGMKPLALITWHYFLQEAAERDSSSLPESKEELHERLISLFARLYPVDTLFPGDVPMEVLMRPVAGCLEGMQLGESYVGKVVGDLYLDPDFLQSKPSDAVELVDAQLLESVGLSVRVSLSENFLKHFSEERKKAS